MESLMDVRQGLATGKNIDYLRQWWEVDYSFIVFDTQSFKSYKKSFTGKYVPYNKGVPASTAATKNLITISIICLLLYFCLQIYNVQRIHSPE